jgi:hypothetical protein
MDIPRPSRTILEAIENALLFMIATPNRPAGRCWITAALLLIGSLHPALSAEVVIPLTIPFEFLTSGMTKKMNAGADGATVIQHGGDCRNLSLDHPQFGRQDQFVRFTSHGTGRAGGEIFGTCHTLIDWRGYIEVLASPSISPDWRLHLIVENSTIYDEAWEEDLLIGFVWDAVQTFVLPSLTHLTVDLTPPRDETLALIRAFVPPAGTMQIDAIFQSATAKAVRVEDSGVVVELAIMVPDRIQRLDLATAVPSGPLSTEELEPIRQKLKQWDAFLVFVIKEIGVNVADPVSREQLVELLIDGRYRILAILAGENGTEDEDPVRALFVETWGRVQEIIRSAEQRGTKLNNAVHYAAFIRAGDVLMTIDRAAPEFGWEVSADGLRRLARILRPELEQDPLEYDLAPDPVLRQLFGLPARFPGEEPLEPVPEDEDVDPDQSFFSIIGNAHAGDLPLDGSLITLEQKLRRWIPKPAELNKYRSVMNDLLLAATAGVLKGAELTAPYQPIFGNLVRATALKESCWRQFVRKQKKITYIRSAAGSIGLMQINPVVWRGFYNIANLKWNIVYNAEAGIEILLRYWLRYGSKAEKYGGSDDIARSTYAVYNAGPGAANRYRDRGSSAREKQVDGRFWEVYRGFKADGRVDLNRCVVVTH